MPNIYSMLKHHTDKKNKTKPKGRAAVRANTLNNNYVQEYLLHYLNELERVTPQAPQKQFHQLLTKLNG